MRENKWLSIITFCTSLLALMGVFIFYNKVNLVYDISLAVLGSALLGFIMSLIQYFAIKRISMETFYQEAIKAVSVLYKAKYFSLDEPLKLIEDCIAESVSNEHCILSREFPKQESKKKLLEFYEPDSILKDSPDAAEKIEIWYTDRIKTYHEELDQCFDSYTNIANMSLIDLGNAYGNLDFIFINK